MATKVSRVGLCPWVMHVAPPPVRICTEKVELKDDSYCPYHQLIWEHLNDDS